MISPFDYAAASDRAASLARVARRLEQALAALRAFDAEGGRRAAREELVEIAAEWLWFYVVQREALGWYDHELAFRTYDVPGELIGRMGPRRRR